MNVFHTESDIFITCPKFISPYLADEVGALGLIVWEQSPTGVLTKGTLTDCMRLSMNLRTANQVLYLIGSFEAKNIEDLYKHLVGISWEKYIAADGYLSVTNHVNNPAIDNTMFANMRVKDAIVDRIKEKKGIRPDSGPDKRRTVIHLHWRESEVKVYIDSSGETLSRHGYRKHPGLAPMQENLAAAVVLATQWEQGKAFVNPMCGSGTLAIEAALIMQNRVPGLFRTGYGFMHILGYDENVYQAERAKLKASITKGVAPIIASDISERAIDQARNNAQTAGVDHLIDFQVCDFRETRVPEGGGVVVFNPEYGERLGDLTELEGTYKAIGDFMKQSCKGYSGYIFTASPDLAKKIGLKAAQKIPFFNSKLECRLLEYELYDGSKRAPLERPSV